ncbi:Ig-like domain-containing protein [Streptosporangium vulgare]|uniref:Ig-like domain-containing protein n=1 Tax=Streptosporangium vulgare TaxID=46190 RepID=A0ABV5THL9_9ACTN
MSLGTAPIDANGRATPAVTGVPPGTHQLVAGFPGNADLDPIASTPLTLVVGPNGLCPAQPTKRKSKNHQSIRNHQQVDNAIKIKDRKRRHHHHHSWVRRCCHPH